MTDYLSAVLDELVPECVDEEGDWERVVADASGKTPAMIAEEWALDGASTSMVSGERWSGSRRRWRTNRRLVAIGLSAGLAALLVTPAFGIGDRLLSLIQGKPRPLDVQAPAWSRDGRTIVFVSWRDGNGEVYAMNADSSEPRNLTQHPAKDVRPAWSTDGRRLAFVSRRDGNSEVYVMYADGSGKRNLTRDRAIDDYPTWSPDGRRIAFLRGRLYSNNPGGLGVHRFYGYHLYVMNADGSGLRRLTLNFTGKHQLVWSPDARTIYFGRYLISTDGSGARRLPYIPLTGVWSPDGRRIAFVDEERGPLPSGGCCASSSSDIYVMNADGSGKRKLTHKAGYNSAPAWSPDGRRIVFQSTRDGNREIYVMNGDGSGKRNLTRHPAQDGTPSWSPDGRRIAFLSDRDGRLDAHVMNADGSGQRNLTLQER